MKTNEIRRGKAAVLAVLTAASLMLTVLMTSMTVHAYQDWQMNRYSVQERLYESVSMFFFDLLALVFCVSVLAFCAAGLVRAVRPPENHGKGESFLKRRGLLAAGIFAAVFVLLLFYGRAVRGRIAETAETSEAPAALSDHVLSGWLSIGALLSLEGAVLFLVLWLRNRRENRPEAKA